MPLGGKQRLLGELEKTSSMSLLELKEGPLENSFRLVTLNIAKLNYAVNQPSRSCSCFSNVPQLRKLLSEYLNYS